ncbi:MAG: SRPBCC family protein [Aliidongia sp.]
MEATAERRTVLKPAPLALSRRFVAPREMVFNAWSSAEHIQRWFSPADCSVPEAEIEFHAGGVFDVCMRLPDGTNHWCKGYFTEVSPYDRLAFDATISTGGEAKFAVRTFVSFTAEAEGTRMAVRQEYEIFDPVFANAVASSAEGWRTTLDKLADEVERIKAASTCSSCETPDAPIERSVVHGSFTLKRVYDAAPSLVFRALSDPVAKARWFAGGDGYTETERQMDIRPGGRERLGGRWQNGMTTLFDAVYFDVVPNARLVYAYEMHLSGRKISVSLATMQLKPVGTGTELTVTEHGSFLDGYDDAGSREHGTGLLLDRLGASLTA